MPYKIQISANGPNATIPSYRLYFSPRLRFPQQAKVHRLNGWPKVEKAYHIIQLPKNYTFWVILDQDNHYHLCHKHISEFAFLWLDHRLHFSNATKGK